ncbi:MAG: Cro/Cl family transcriptional regulator [bacterium]|nr:MAG: Cro/Cl family transcriptional regulator [bacterium]
MIKIQLNELLEKQGRTMYWLAKQSGVRYATIFNLCKQDASKLRLSTIDQICKALGCQPGDLLIYLPDDKQIAKPKSKIKSEKE